VRREDVPIYHISSSDELQLAQPVSEMFIEGL
jgi:hypothetical protein